MSFCDSPGGEYAVLGLIVVVMAVRHLDADDSVARRGYDTTVVKNNNTGERFEQAKVERFRFLRSQADIHLSFGMVGKAHEALTEALSIVRSLLPANHWCNRRIEQDLRFLVQLQMLRSHEFDLARECLNEIRKADAEFAQGQFGTAITRYQGAIHIYDSLNMAPSPVYLDVVNGIGKAQLLLARSLPAVSTFEREMSLGQNTDVAQGERWIINRLYLGMALMRTERFWEAEPFLIAAYKAARLIPHDEVQFMNTDSNISQGASISYGVFLNHIEEFGLAKSLLKEAKLATGQSLQGECEIELSRSLFGLGDLDAARQMAQESKAILDPFPRGHRQRSLLACRVGQNLIRCGDRDDGAALLSEAILAFDEVPNDEIDKDRIDCYRGWVHWSRGEMQAADMYFERCMSVVSRQPIAFTPPIIPHLEMACRVKAAVGKTQDQARLQKWLDRCREELARHKQTRKN